jgi:hypothetical protein
VFLFGVLRFQTSPDSGPVFADGLYGHEAA